MDAKLETQALFERVKRSYGSQASLLLSTSKHITKELRKVKGLPNIIIPQNDNSCQKRIRQSIHKEVTP